VSFRKHPENHAKIKVQGFEYEVVSFYQSRVVKNSFGDTDGSLKKGPNLQVDLRVESEQLTNPLDSATDLGCLVYWAIVET